MIRLLRRLVSRLARVALGRSIRAQVGAVAPEAWAEPEAPWETLARWAEVQERHNQRAARVAKIQAWLADLEREREAQRRAEALAASDREDN